MNSSQTSNNPWLALSTYEETDSYRFKGRDEDIERLFNMIQQNELAVCYAASGDGKSSLINAGLCPKLRRVGYFPVKIVFSTSEYNGNNIPLKQDGTYDIDAFMSRKIDESIRTYQSHFEKEKGLEFGGYPIAFKHLPEFRESEARNTLWWKLRTESIEIPFGEFDYRPLLIFDQFEEIFSAKWKSDFFAWLETLMNDTCPRHLIEKEEREQLPSSKQFKVLFSLRYEYVGELDYWSSQQYFIPQMMRNRYFLKPMTREQAVRAIKEQDGVGLMREQFNSAAERIVDDIIASESVDGSNPQIPSIVLSVLCFKYYEAWSVDSNASVDALNANNLIYEYYKSVFDDKSIGISPDRRNGLEDILISNSGTRRRMPSSDERLLALNINKPLLMQLKEKHILRIDSVLDSNGKTEDYVELVHDRVVKAIFECRKAEKEAQAKERRKFRRRMVLLTSVFLLLSAVIVCAIIIVPQHKKKIVVENGVLMGKYIDANGLLSIPQASDTIVFMGNNVVDDDEKPISLLSHNTKFVLVKGDNVTFPQGAFEASLVEKLKIDNANNVYFEKESFSHCCNLSEIEVDGNNINFQDGALRKCCKLSSITLDGNNDTIDLPSTRDGVNLIRTLDVRGKHIKLLSSYGSCPRYQKVSLTGDDISIVRSMFDIDTLYLNGTFKFENVVNQKYGRDKRVLYLGKETKIEITGKNEGFCCNKLITNGNLNVRIDSSSLYKPKMVYIDSTFLGEFDTVFKYQTDVLRHPIGNNKKVVYPSKIWISKNDRVDSVGEQDFLGGVYLRNRNIWLRTDSAVSVNGYRCFGNFALIPESDTSSQVIIAENANKIIIWPRHKINNTLYVPKSVEEVVLLYPLNDISCSYPCTVFVPKGWGNYCENKFSDEKCRVKELGALQTFWYRMQSLIKPYNLFPFLYPLVTFILIAVYVYWGRLRNPKSPYIYENRKRALVSVLMFPLIYYLFLVLDVIVCINMGYRPNLLNCCFWSVLIWFCIDLISFTKNVKKKNWKEKSHKERVFTLMGWVIVFLYLFLLIEHIHY